MNEKLELIKKGKLDLEKRELEYMSSKLRSNARPLAGANIVRKFIMENN